MTDRTQVLESAIGQQIDQFNWQQRMQEGVLVELKIVKKTINSPVLTHNPPLGPSWCTPLACIQQQIDR